MIDTSLKNLGMDYVDLYIYHMWDWNTPLYDILDGLDRIVKAGKARYIGISNCFAWQLAKANAQAEKIGTIIIRRDSKRFIRTTSAVILDRRFICFGASEIL